MSCCRRCVLFILCRFCFLLFVVNSLFFVVFNCCLLFVVCCLLFHSEPKGHGTSRMCPYLATIGLGTQFQSLTWRYDPDFSRYSCIIHPGPLLPSWPFSDPWESRTYTIMSIQQEPIDQQQKISVPLTGLALEPRGVGAWTPHQQPQDGRGLF